MMLKPDKQEFIKRSIEGNIIPVCKEIPMGRENPVSAFKKIEGEYSFLLESIEGGEKIARYSFLGTCENNNVHELSSFKEIKKILGRYRAVKVPGLPRFHGGLVGYVGYDMVREIEKIPDKNNDDLKIPKMLFLKADAFLAFDHKKKTIAIIANAFIEGDPEKAYDDAAARISGMENALRRQVEYAGAGGEKRAVKFSSNMTEKEYGKIVEKAKEYIKAGDIIQTVLSQRFAAESKADPFNVYRILREMNPSPYMYYLKFGGLKIVGASPEVMVRLEDGFATLRPIAGTRRRGRDKAEDLAMEKELLASEKERAEHIMLVDLGRNDLGRVCDFGSVKVTEKMAIERYSHVMHIVSNVTGKLKPGMDSVDLLEATFPAGTVSGAPKVRAMEIIDELENVKRGPYAGAIGYFGFSGEMDTCITIRTIIFKDGKAYVQVGAGIVADSIPSEEYKETMNKARAMLAALETAA